MAKATWRFWGARYGGVRPRVPWTFVAAAMRDGVATVLVKGDAAPDMGGRAAKMVREVKR